MRKWLLVGSVLLVCCAWCVASYAEVSEEQAALAKESEAYCASTAKDTPTVGVIMEKVSQAVALLNQEGANAFPKFSGKGSEFIFNGTYIWVHGEDGTMLMHPIKPAMIGQDVLGIKDGDGKTFFQEMNKIVNEKGDGWVEYKWPKPGQKEGSVKVSYVHSATVDGKKVIVGCGVYDLTLKDVEAALKK